MRILCGWILHAIEELKLSGVMCGILRLRIFPECDDINLFNLRFPVHLMQHSYELHIMLVKLLFKPRQHLQIKLPSWAVLK